MRNFLVIAIIIIFQPVAYSQRNDTLDQHSIEVINRMVKDKRPWILLVREIDNYTINEMMRTIGDGIFIKNIHDEHGSDLSEKLVLSLDELESVKRAIANMTTFKWLEVDAQKLNLDRIRIISPDSSLYPTLDISIKYRIAPPIFIRNREYCFLYFDYACGPLCGAIRFEILKKTLNGWKLWKTLILSNS